MSCFFYIDVLRNGFPWKIVDRFLIAFLKGCVAVSLFTVLLLFVVPAVASPSVDVFDVSYLWHHDLDSVLDYKGEIQRVLGRAVQKKLKVVVRTDGLYGLVYDRNGSAASSAKVAESHSRLLGRFNFDKAAPIRDSGYHELFNISYGVGPHLTSLRQRYKDVYQMLGKDTGKDLVIEKLGSGSYALILRCLTDRTTAAIMAVRHKNRLQSEGISAAISRETSHHVVFGESSFLDSEPVMPGAFTEEMSSATDDPVLSEPLQQIVPTKQKKEFAALNNSGLDEKIDGLIEQLRRQGQVAADEKTAWVVSDLVTGEILADINKDEAMQAANLIKPFVALAFFHQVKEKKLLYGPQSRRHMEAMLQRSSNRSTNWVLRHVGGPDAADTILHRHYPDIFRSTRIVEYIPEGGRTYQNRASAEDYDLFLQRLWARTLPHGKELRRIMALPSHSRLYHGTRLPRGTLVYNKTGSTARLCGDMGILAPRGADGRRYPYTLVAIIEKESRASNYGSWMLRRGNVIRKVSNLVYSEMKKRHNLL